jgi:hypothetical protein
MFTKYTINLLTLILLLQAQTSARNENRHFGQYTAGVETCQSAVRLLMQSFTAPDPKNLSLMPASD